MVDVKLPELIDDVVNSIYNRPRNVIKPITCSTHSLTALQRISSQCYCSVQAVALHSHMKQQTGWKPAGCRDRAFTLFFFAVKVTVERWGGGGVLKETIFSFRIVAAGISISSHFQLQHFTVSDVFSIKFCQRRPFVSLRI